LASPALAAVCAVGWMAALAQVRSRLATTRLLPLPLPLRETLPHRIAPAPMHSTQ